MNIFISWSGEASRIVAEALKSWLPTVIQSLTPFVSSEDIAKGTRWSTEIGETLQKTNFGILCLTPMNIKEPWILFEAGAISKSIGESRVAPILLGLAISDLEGPLAQFNAAFPNKEDVLKLLKSINDKLETVGEAKLVGARLERIFDAMWSDLEEKIKICEERIKADSADAGPPTPKRSADEILEELLELTRNNARLLSDVNVRIEKSETTKLSKRPAYLIGELEKADHFNAKTLKRYNHLTESITHFSEKIEEIERKIGTVDIGSLESQKDIAYYNSLLAEMDVAKAMLRSNQGELELLKKALSEE